MLQEEAGCQGFDKKMTTLEHQTRCQLYSSRIPRKKSANVVELRVRDEKEARSEAETHIRTERGHGHSRELRGLEL
jgi:hypothetical protein